MRSMGSQSLPRGPRFPLIPSTPSVNPFSDINEHRDPFADPKTTVPEILAPEPLRFTVRNGVLQNNGLLKTPTTDDETFTLTDPRLGESRRLTVANRSNRDSLPSPALPPVPPLYVKRPQESTPVAQGSRFSWSTKAATPSTIGRASTTSSTSSTSLPQFKTVSSWARHQTKRLHRHPEEDNVDSPKYAKTEKNYDRTSLNSGMDTRRTEYDYSE